MSYEDLAEDLIDSMKDFLGDGAADVAREVQGLEVDSSGNVTRIEGDAKSVVGDLASAYLDRLGDAAASKMKGVANSYSGELDLPPSLR